MKKIGALIIFLSSSLAVFSQTTTTTLWSESFNSFSRNCNIDDVFHFCGYFYRNNVSNGFEYYAGSWTYYDGPLFSDSISIPFDLSFSSDTVYDKIEWVNAQKHINIFTDMYIDTDISFNHSSSSVYEQYVDYSTLSSIDSARIKNYYGEDFMGVEYYVEPFVTKVGNMGLSYSTNNLACENCSSVSLRDSLSVSFDVLHATFGGRVFVRELYTNYYGDRKRFGSFTVSGLDLDTKDPLAYNQVYDLDQNFDLRDAVYSANYEYDPYGYLSSVRLYESGYVRLSLNDVKIRFSSNELYLKGTKNKTITSINNKEDLAKNSNDILSVYGLDGKETEISKLLDNQIYVVLFNDGHREKIYLH